MARRVAFLLLCFFVYGAPARAASPWQRLAGPVFVRADTRELPEAAVMSLAQDRAGFVWVGTQGGLARFDGYHFRSFLPNPSDSKALPDGYVRAMLPDTNGGLWVGSSSNGLVHFDAATETFRTWHPDRAGSKGPRSASVDALAQAPDGALWVGGDRGLSRFDVGTNTFTPVALTAAGQQPVVWSLLVDRNGTLWAGTQGGLFYRPARAAHFREWVFDASGRTPKAIVYSLLEDTAGRLWAGSVNELLAIDPARRSARAVRSAPGDANSLAPGQQWALIEPEPGVLWAGTDSALSVVDVASGAVHRVDTDFKSAGGLSGGRVLGFLRDRSGLIWLANHIGGLLWYNPLSRGLYQISATRPELRLGDEGAPAVAAVRGGRLWVGGFKGHLTELDPLAAQATSVTVPNGAAIQTLLPASDGTLWIGTTGGLCLEAAGESAARCPARPSELASSSIYALLSDGKRLWVGGSGGLVADDTVSESTTSYPRAGTLPLSNDQVRVLYRDHRRRLWIGTENGLDRLDPNGRLTRFVFAPGASNSIGPGGMATLLEDRRGRMWAGAAGGPLDVLQENRDGTETIRRLGIPDGLPHENVDGLAEDARGRIWASTDKGLAIIDPDTLHARALGPADGVSDGAYWAGTVSEAADGTIFFGGLTGITVIAPGASSAWTYAPPVVISTLRVGRRTMPAAAVNGGDATIELPANARDVNLEFSSLDYSAPQALRYQYKLDGYDRDWIDADAQHRSANYSHVAPGDYTLEVRGTNRSGVWSVHVLRLGVRALPAWYETWWFRVLLAALVLVAAYATHRIRTAVLRRRQRELETIVSERTHALSDANAKLEELSLSDPLTGLRNRRFLTQHLDTDVALTLRRYEDWRADATRSAPEDSDILFFLVDLDNFKAVNDRFGHHAGDLLLMQMRERLQEVFRESDFFVRWGGDEFLTVARASPRTDAPVIAERLREAVANRAFAIGGEQSMRTTVSVGWAAFPFVQAAPGALTWFQVVDLADHALYMAKEAGRNTWFGLGATRQTDPVVLTRHLEHGAEEAVRAGALEVFHARPQ